MNRLFAILLLVANLPIGLLAQPISEFRVLFYNTENFFDCKHDPGKEDKEFLPESVRRWHTGRMKQKASNLAKAIVAAGNGDIPDLIGLCEVENPYVMDYFTRYSPLKQLGYRYVMTDSPDARGIDVALLYQRERFKLLQTKTFRIDPRPWRGTPTRDILLVTGQLPNRDTLDVFVVHFPSRRGGEKESEPARIGVASRLRTLRDSLCARRSRPLQVIMGDFNDQPFDRSVSSVLQAKPLSEAIHPFGLYNPFYRKKGASRLGNSSYKYCSEWMLFDQILLSGNFFLNRSRCRYKSQSAIPLLLPFLLEEDEKYGDKRPFRTYWGMKYVGGFSDHLPIALSLNLGE